MITAAAIAERDRAKDQPAPLADDLEQVAEVEIAALAIAAFVPIRAKVARAALMRVRNLRAVRRAEVRFQWPRRGCSIRWSIGSALIQNGRKIERIGRCSESASGPP